MKTAADFLTEANDLLRSAHSIAERKGENTNWEVWRKRLETVLVEQNQFLRGTSHLPAAICTPKVFKMPRCIWPDCGHDTNRIGYGANGCDGIGCPARKDA